jgi:Ribosomal protein L7/L12 dimerisation domain
MFEDKKFGVEHALNLHAHSYSLFPALTIYDEEALKPLMPVIEKCHIYFIGKVPRVDFVGARQSDRTLFVSMEVLGKVYEINWPLPEGMNLMEEEELWYLLDEQGRRSFPTTEAKYQKLAQTYDCLQFDVQYIGQAYGTDGSRNALDRLKKHETLQKIALQGVPEGCRLELLLLQVVPATRVITVFNPKAEDKTHGGERIKAGLDKLFGTDEKERVSLFEAACIRYFMPPFNERLKDSFPSTNMKVLKDCYDKDFSAIIAEIGFDARLPFKLCSDQVDPKDHHIASFNLSKEEDRAVFFSPSRKAPAHLLKLVDEMSNLTVKEAADLSKLLKDKWQTPNQ